LFTPSGPAGAASKIPLCAANCVKRAISEWTLLIIHSTRTDYDYDFRNDYLSWHIHYHLGADEKRGLARFIGVAAQTYGGACLRAAFRLLD